MHLPPLYYQSEDPGEVRLCTFAEAISSFPNIITIVPSTYYIQRDKPREDPAEPTLVRWDRQEMNERGALQRCGVKYSEISWNGRQFSALR